MVLILYSAFNLRFLDYVTDKVNMKFINTTGNTVTLADINKTIPYIGNSEQDIDSDDILKSRSFQSLVVSGHFVVTEIGNRRIEQNLMRAQNTTNGVSIEPPIEVMIKGNFTNNTGYAKANRNLVYALNRAGVKVGISPIKEEIGTLNEFELARIGRFRRQLGEKAIFIHSAVPTFAEQTNGYRILNTTIEASSIPSQFVEACDMYDEVWVASEFCRDVFISSGVKKPIYVIPNAVDPRIYNTKAVPHSFVPSLKKFVFISVFGWNYRKGYDVLLKAYLDEFTDDDHVSLLIVSKYQQDGNGRRKYEVDSVIRDYKRRYPKAAHIARCGRDITEMEMPRIYRASHCFVLPSRGEGFGLPYVEAGMCGLPVIATNYGAQTMYLNDSNAYLVNIDKLIRFDGGTTNVHFWDGQLFPALSDDNVIKRFGELMRHVMNNTDEANAKASQLRTDLNKYTLDSVGALAKARLGTIWNNL